MRRGGDAAHEQDLRTSQEQRTFSHFGERFFQAEHRPYAGNYGRQQDGHPVGLTPCGSAPANPGIGPGECPSATIAQYRQSGRVITNHNCSSSGVAIVTGGSHGIGRAVARELASADYAVVISYLDSQPAADAAVEEILSANGTAVAVRADVADALDVERLFSETIDAFGHVDVVVHAAARTILETVPDHGLETFDAPHRVDARGTLVVNHQASLQVRDGGAIVNFSSSGVVDAITPILARDLSVRDVTVNTIALGPELPNTPADVAKLVVFLVSDDGHWINGQVIRACD
jgi:3-oxoacyl-[acyl-carrier protein] reductase